MEVLCRFNPQKDGRAVTEETYNLSAQNQQLVPSKSHLPSENGDVQTTLALDYLRRWVSMSINALSADETWRRPE